MIMEGCQGKPKVEIYEKKCPNCGNMIEIFSVDTEATCEKCGFKIYNDKLTCVKWCKYAKQCVGEDMYRALMAAADRLEEKQKAERAEKAAKKAAEAAKASAGTGKTA